MDDVVVVDAGLAGLRTCEQLRARGFTGRLMLVGAESHPLYDRPPLSKQVLRGEREVTWLRAESAYSELDLELRLGTPPSGLSRLKGETHAGFTADHRRCRAGRL